MTVTTRMVGATKFRCSEDLDLVGRVIAEKRKRFREAVMASVEWRLAA